MDTTGWDRQRLEQELTEHYIAAHVKSHHTRRRNSIEPVRDVNPAGRACD